MMKIDKNSKKSLDSFGPFKCYMEDGRQGRLRALDSASSQPSGLEIP